MTAPRRLDVDYLPDGYELRCFVNGERQAFVRFYDMDEGIVERVMTDGDGHILHIAGEAIILTLGGKVQCELVEPARCQR